MNNVKFGMPHFLAVSGLAILCLLSFNLKDETAKGVLIGTCASSVGFFTGTSSPLGGRK